MAIMALYLSLETPMFTVHIVLLLSIEVDSKTKISMTYFFHLILSNTVLGILIVVLKPRTY